MSFGNIMEHFISTEITQYQVALRLFQTIRAFDYFFVSRSSKIKIKIKTLFFFLSCSQSQQSLFELMIHVIGPLPQQLEPIQSGEVERGVFYRVGNCCILQKMLSFTCWVSNEIGICIIILKQYSVLPTSEQGMQCVLQERCYCNEF